VNPLPAAGIISGRDSACQSAIIIMTESVGGGRWSSSNGAVASIDSVSGTILPNAPGTAIITYTTARDVNGCAGIASLPIRILSSSAFYVAGNITPAKCYGSSDGSISLSLAGGSGNFTYMWQDGSVLSLLNAIPAGSYSVTVTDTITQCMVSRTFALSQPDAINITSVIGSDVCKQKKGSISVAVNGGIGPYTFAWAHGAAGSELVGLYAGSYSVTVTDANTCSRNETYTVNDSSGQVVVHNGITPNNDGYNDTWIIDYIQDYPNNDVKVYDKWGDLVWEQHGYNNNWEGIGLKNEKLPDGTYYYVLLLNSDNNACGAGLFKGAILIKR
jgi:gliding motility-associated-like protein